MQLGVVGGGLCGRTANSNPRKVLDFRAVFAGWFADFVFDDGAPSNNEPLIHSIESRNIERLT